MPLWCIETAWSGEDEYLTSEPNWAHLIPLVDALMATGNTVQNGGFRPNQGGIDCWMDKQLGIGVLAPLILLDAQGSNITVSSDEVFCRH